MEIMTAPQAEKVTCGAAKTVGFTTGGDLTCAATPPSSKGESAPADDRKCLDGFYGFYGQESPSVSYQPSIHNNQPRTSLIPRPTMLATTLLERP